ncbi:MAG: imidazole glycerol phosphate synthase subunit HisH [Candidatus Omnitrophica bacterium]|nr:imidazole glycerol phosphate synthase subunit HisH [Candidatus Omnitrophota bacterium]MBU1924984.1 imidazole glycerol phosphate synthase subunit HisH [Candidatus Omnitrophota bacterium]
MIALIDYKMGNLRSVAKALEAVGAEVTVTHEPAKLRRAQALVLPGVGAFSAGMSNLRKMKLITPIKEAIRAGKPFLGICLGAQLLFTESEEHGRHLGLGIIPGRVVKFRSALKIPHMGWNTITKVTSHKSQDISGLLNNIPDGAYFYFVHSYYVKPKKKDMVLALSEYGQKFAAVVGKDNTFGIQFHPEKSSELGLKILENFCRICGEIK